MEAFASWLNAFNSEEKRRHESSEKQTVFNYSGSAVFRHPLELHVNVGGLMFHYFSLIYNLLMAAICILHTMNEPCDYILTELIIMFGYLNAGPLHTTLKANINRTINEAGCKNIIHSPVFRCAFRYDPIIVLLWLLNDFQYEPHIKIRFSWFSNNWSVNRLHKIFMPACV